VDLATAFVLVNSELGAEKQIVADLKAIKNVKEVHEVYGVYDVIVKVEADSIGSVKEVIMEKIRKLERVRSTLTMLAIE
jgi:DNA-binding Lrp family transcriptional regulator